MRSPHEIMREQDEKEKVHILNTITGRGAFQCKKALMHNEWDIKKAIAWLEKHSDNDMFRETREVRKC